MRVIEAEVFKRASRCVPAPSDQQLQGLYMARLTVVLRQCLCLLQRRLRNRYRGRFGAQQIEPGMQDVAHHQFRGSLESGFGARQRIGAQAAKLREGLVEQDLRLAIAAGQLVAMCVFHCSMLHESSSLAGANGAYSRGGRRVGLKSSWKQNGHFRHDTLGSC